MCLVLHLIIPTPRVEQLNCNPNKNQHSNNPDTDVDKSIRVPIPIYIDKGTHENVLSVISYWAFSLRTLLTSSTTRSLDYSFNCSDLCLTWINLQVLSCIIKWKPLINTFSCLKPSFYIDRFKELKILSHWPKQQWHQTLDAVHV